jgi:hypothetical protein
MSLGMRIISAIVLLAAALGVKLSLDSAAAWRDARNAERCFYRTPTAPRCWRLWELSPRSADW